MTVIINGTTGIDTVQDGIVTDAKLTLTANSQEIKDSLNASGSAPIYACRAWVNFNGTGTVAIRSSGNVSSITDNGTGDYTVNFSTAMSDINYSANVTGNVLSGAGNTSGWIAAELLSGASASYRTSSSFRLFTTGLNGSNQDGYSVNLSFFR